MLMLGGGSGGSYLWTGHVISCLQYPFSTPCLRFDSCFVLFIYRIIAQSAFILLTKSLRFIRETTGSNPVVGTVPEWSKGEVLSSSAHCARGFEPHRSHIQLTFHPVLLRATFSLFTTREETAADIISPPPPLPLPLPLPLPPPPPGGGAPPSSPISPAIHPSRIPAPYRRTRPSSWRRSDRMTTHLPPPRAFAIDTQCRGSWWS